MSSGRLTVEDYAALREAGEPHLLLDVRENWEVETAAIAGAVTIPLGSLVERAAELPRDQMVVVMCHHGGRSMQATQWLRGNGWSGATNLDGGIDAWSRQIDGTVPRY